MPEGLSPADVGRDIAEHHKRTHDDVRSGRDRLLTIAEAVLLSLVALLAAWSGYAASKWSTKSSVDLAHASSDRTKASRSNLEAQQVRTLDSVSFNAWFTAFVGGKRSVERIAERRLRPGYRPAFHAWLATDPAHNPNAPPGPAFMPQYVIPQEALSKREERAADAAFSDGASAGSTSDKYVRDTVFLASILFLVGISGHFPVRQGRYGLVAIGMLILVFAVVQILELPGPPG